MKTQITITLLALACATLSACSDDNNTTPPATSEPDPAPQNSVYSITVTNLTAAQPMSPVAVVMSEQPVWHIGQPASDALATLAEGGDNSQLTADEAVTASTSAQMPLPPGDSQTLQMMVEAGDEQPLSVVTMLVNTNDAFSGFTGLSLNDMAVGDTVVRRTSAYDAGSEDNTEAAGTIPGPADNGEGVSEGRETLDAVTLHQGVLSQDDGLPSSVLRNEHRFDNPVLLISVTKVE